MGVTPRTAVVVGVDGSESALGAVRWAAAEAARRGAPLRLVAAVTWTVYQPIGVPALGVEYQRQILVQAAGQYLEAAAATAQQVAPELDVTTEVRGGEPTTVLRDEATRARMIVLGTRGRGGFTGLLLGLVAIAVAAHAEAPVIVVRGNGALRDTAAPIVVGVDRGPQGEAALAFAFDEATRRRVPLVAVHAWGDPIIDPYLAGYVDRDVIEADERQTFDERLVTWTAKYPDVPVERVVARDSAAAALVHRSRDAALVVVGSRGRGTVRGLLLGSVGQAVLHHADAPVAVVRPEADRAE
ncbi:universal stress protein [Pseudonocardia halophobica]|uniref:Universal stress protein n=1 Tax=Pseudonocardia halophobica TaxID=29401 RepID=A0A9W6KXK3_9PSEU|nr:universal stress protein [Pseudonocardia halophobica]GLL09548.1 universal stress protein [Pseudonocardia halophobica]